MIQPEDLSVGEILRQAREQMGVSLEDATRATHIRSNYLFELEADHPEKFTSAAQAKGFLRLYALFLNLPAAELIGRWEAPEKTEKPAPREESRKDEENIISGITISDEESSDSEDLQSESDTESEIDSLTESPRKKGEENHWLADIRMKLASLGLAQKFKALTGKPSLVPLPGRNEIQETPPPAERSAEIFSEIGQALISRRQKMDLSLTDVEHFTNIRRMYLIAMEDGRFNDLPSTVQGRGMLNNYAQFLAMDDSAVMERYAQALQLQREERMAPIRKPVEPPVSVKVNLPDGIRRILNPDLIVGGALILALFAFILWGASQMLGSSGGAATEAPSISEMLQITPSVSPSPDLTRVAEGAQPPEEATSVPGVAIVESTPTPLATVNAAPLQLYIIANDRAYLRVNVDGVEVFNGRVAPENAYTFSGNDQISLLTGNASALEVYFNQEYLGILGGVGDVVDMRFTPSGLSTATTGVSPTATEDPRTAEEPMMEEGN